MALVKSAAAAGASRLLPQCRFETSLFLIGHMRCGSTALSAIICSRADVSGYGEAHIAYSSRAALGQLALNQARRRAWSASATTLFDKVLHSRYDVSACSGFFTSRALFMARAPQPSIRSIRHLFEKIGSGEYASDAAAADYYEERLGAMLQLWPRFAADRRVALTYEALTGDPDQQLDRLSARLRFSPPLVNRYAIKSAAGARGAGDPLTASRHDRIVATVDKPVNGPPLALEPDRLAALESLYRDFCALD